MKRSIEMSEKESPTIVKNSKKAPRNILKTFFTIEKGGGEKQGRKFLLSDAN